MNTGSAIAVFVGGWRCGRSCEVNPDSAPAEIYDHASAGLYRLTERVTGRGAFPVAGAPIYEYEPARAARQELVAGGCRCGCRRPVATEDA